MSAVPRSAWRFLPVAVVAGLFLIIGGAAEIVRFATDLLWFQELGQEVVFWRTLWNQFATGLLVGVAFFILLYGNILIARRMAPRSTPGPSGDLRVDLEQMILQLRERLDPYINLILFAGSVVLSILLGTAAAGHWSAVQMALHGVPFGEADPQFGRDVGFYVFQLPALRLLADSFIFSVALTLAVTAGVHLLDGAIRPWARLQGFEPHVKAHLSVLMGVLALGKVFDYYLQAFELNFSPRGQVLGASYTDVYAQLPALRILMVIAALSAVVLLVNIRFRGWRLPALAVGVWVAAAVLVGRVYPALVQQFRVAPNEVAAEAPFIKRNIEYTRKAFDLDRVEVHPFAASETLTADDLASERATIDNVRLWDPTIVVQSYKQLQEIRFYYDFDDVDIDRYTIDGVRRQVLISVRELNVDQLSEQAKTWVNRHLVYTHGYGAVVSPVNEASKNGLPTFLIKDIPPATETDLHIRQPAIYFGHETKDYVIARTALPEFDYPVGDKNAVKSYDGKAGVPIGGLLRRALFAVRFGSAKILLSEYIRPDSRVLFARTLKERIGRLAPWLTLDQDPYPAIVDGRIVWILDGYTHSSRYPYSQPLAGGLNYIRNPVKITVDAYDGTTTLYAIDEEEPILATWRQIFPGLVVDGSTMPEGVRAHLRYPEDLFRVQAEAYKVYHMRDPQVFYNKEDQWAVPGEVGQRGRMTPFYVLMRLPGAASEEFMLMLPFTPRNKDNMIGWMAAKCDPQDYGQRVVFTFPKQKLILGPEQVSARINQDPTVSQQLTLWNQRGSSVLFGNMLVLPIKDSIVYIQPLYLQAEQTAMPALTRVIVVSAERVAMEPDLASALFKVFGAARPAPPPAGAGAAPTAVSEAGRAAPTGWSQAQELYQKALDAQRAGDWSGYGRHIQELGHLIDQMTEGR